ncbi:TetR/AcrR family transcriptional regulator [Actinoplanes couchii]|uniref:TetR family transcriptional regulator n=1 Tax=Actinoplanes couchii TaxID=403638 RepID=A0ABQ3XLX1_9ACTN|nr:TetR/AcrR family transcriptional regulator [Actinoplanes couchii]MDR6319272.1 AcrR family transcriptional regulator [Actinoplanes couchii]GID59519.1 TetR family transcriptional regulator [Actinoplanes couchii]
MGRTAGRSPADTRRAVLDAAGDVIRARGVNASLDDIARHAGVSKGGLLYHFASKDDLIRELVRTLLEAFRTDIENRLDPTDNDPGRLTRAYVRALLAPLDDEVAARQSIALLALLTTIPEVAELVAADTDQLNAELYADGLPVDVMTLVTAAADGVSSAPLWGASIRGPEFRTLERRLIQITRQPELWESIPWS